MGSLFRCYNTREVMNKKNGNNTRIEINGTDSDEFVAELVDILARSCLEGYFQNLLVESQNSQRYNDSAVDDSVTNIVS